MKVSTIIKKIEAHKARIAKDRDSLRDLIMELEGLQDICASAHDDLEYAVDKLSELV